MTAAFADGTNSFVIPSHRIRTVLTACHQIRKVVTLKVLPAHNNRWKSTGWLAATFLLGIILSLWVGDSKGTMQIYAMLLAATSAAIVMHRAFKGIETLLSCYTMVMLSPIWFLYAEAMLANGDCWLLPAHQVIRALSSAVFFLIIFNIAYCARPPRRVVRFHEANFNRIVPPNFLPFVGVALTVVTFFVVLARYGYDWGFVKAVYLSGREGGSGLIRRGGIGGWEVFLQPLDFMCSTIPTIAALSWVQFSNETRASMWNRVLVSSCAAFLIFVMFLGGSRGYLAVYIAGPFVVWLTFGHRTGRLPFLITTACLFFLLIGVWDLQQRKRNNILSDIGSLADFAAQTTFNPTKSHRDNNLYMLTLHHMYMPSPFPFDGYAELGYFLANPIPRALWPGKPKGIQEDEESFRTPKGPPSLGPIPMGTASLSYSIVGDGFKMHHYFGIAVYAVIFGIIGSMWDLMPRKGILDSRLYFILNSAWCFWFLWGFRAAFAFVTGMYPVWGAYLLCFAGGRLGKVPDAAPDGLRPGVRGEDSGLTPVVVRTVRGRSKYADYLHGSKP